MKPVKNLLFALLLVSAMAVSTPAGEQDTPGYAAPPPPPRMTATTETDETIPVTSTDTQETMVENTDYLFFEVLAALLSVY